MGADSKGTVLVVDDEPTIVEIVARYMERAGYETYGANPLIHVVAAGELVNLASRYGTSGPVIAGAGLYSAGVCTAGYSARVSSDGGGPPYSYFVLTAGHCFEIGDVIHREERKFQSGPEIGVVRRDGAKKGQYYVVDGAAIAIPDSRRSHSVPNGEPLEAQPIQGVQAPWVGEEVCWSGIFINKKCGTIFTVGLAPITGERKRVFFVEGASIEGDSGGPVWDPKTHMAVGLVTSGLPLTTAGCPYTSYNARACPLMAFTPLSAAGGSNGIEPTLGVQVLAEQ